MSQKKYCPKCAKATAYTDGIAPRFCGGCGCEFAAAFRVAPQPTVPAVKKLKKKYIEMEVDDDEMDEDSEFDGQVIVPQKFQYELNLPKRITVEDVIKRGEQIQGGVNPILGPSSID